MNINRSRCYRRTMLALLLAGVIISSCSDNPALRARYEAEQKLHAAVKALERAQSIGGQMSPEDLRQIFDNFQRASDFCHSKLTEIDPAVNPVEFNELKFLALQSSTHLASLFFSVRQYDKSEAVLNRALDELQLSKKQRLPVYLNLGRTIQAAGNFDSARAIYDFVIADYYPPIDESGEVTVGAFSLPMQLFNTFKMVGDSAAASTMFDRAEEYYLGLIDLQAGPKLTSASRASLADLYNEDGQWQRELDQLRLLADSTEGGYSEIMIRMADVFGGRLKEYDSALAILEHLTARLTPADTALEPVLQFKLAVVKMEIGEYDAARGHINRIKREYPAFYASNPMPQFTLARSFDREGNWRLAEQEYGLLIEKYRGTDEAMMSLIYVIDNLKSQGREAEAATWQRMAEMHFSEVAIDGAGTAMEAKALFYRAELYRRNNRIDTSAEILLSISDKFPGTEPGRRALLAAAKLYRDNLQNPAKADSLLATLKTQMAQPGPTAQDTDLFTD